jgi:hypothetical protein
MAVRAQKSQIGQLVVQVIAIDVIQLEWYGLGSPSLAPTPRASALQDALADEAELQFSGLHELVECENLLEGPCRPRWIHLAQHVSLPGPV